MSERVVSIASLLRSKKSQSRAVKTICPFCTAHSVKKGRLKQHYALHYSFTHLPNCHHHSYRCNACQVVKYTLNDVKSHWRSDHKEVVCCDVCSKIYDNRGMYNEHMIIHDRRAKEPHLCDICGKGYENMNTLQAHYWCHMEKSVRCLVCYKVFSDNEALVDHRKKDKCEKPYLCSVCGKVFSRKCGLIVHSKNCVGVRRFTNETNTIVLNSKAEHPDDVKFKSVVQGLPEMNRKPNPELKTYSRVRKKDSADLVFKIEDKFEADITLPINIKNEPAW